ncbi:unnamed protein product [Protopolystoma xenopodis]|uniref:Uncharacterized protein n=1 Tax=Protopolystoma xenopodis TaxID=117903 RepID=A0A448WK16_9PLAT|nr:unnamed protein product [Protopolystoma xenopodis]
MIPGSDDVYDRTDEGSARIHRGRKTLSQGLLGTIKQTKVQGNPPVVSVQANLRIPSTRLLNRNEKSRVPLEPSVLHPNPSE